MHSGGEVCLQEREKVSPNQQAHTHQGHTNRCNWSLNEEGAEEEIGETEIVWVHTTVG